MVIVHGEDDHMMHISGPKKPFSENIRIGPSQPGSVGTTNLNSCHGTDMSPSARSIITTIKSNNSGAF
jgi:hypothetical protein